MNKILVFFLVLAFSLSAQVRKVYIDSLLIRMKNPDTGVEGYGNITDYIKATVSAKDTNHLKSLNFTGNQAIFLSGLSSTNKSGAGWFVVADSAYPAGIAFEHPTTGKQWVRQEFLDKKIVNVKWFGLLGDGLNNDISNFRKMLEVIDDSTVVYFPKGIYYIPANNELIPKNISFVGDGKDKTIIKMGGKAGGSYGFLVTNKKVEFKGITFSDFRYAINVGQSSIDTINGLKIIDCKFVNGAGAIYSTSSNGVLKNLIIENCEIYDCYQGIVLGLTVSKAIITDNIIKNIGYGIKSPWASVYGILINKTTEYVNGEIVITNNIIDSLYNNDPSNAGQNIGMLISGYRVTVDGNILSNFRDSVYADFNGMYLYAKGITISNNILYNTSKYEPGHVHSDYDAQIHIKSVSNTSPGSIIISNNEIITTNVDNAGYDIWTNTSGISIVNNRIYSESSYNVMRIGMVDGDINTNLIISNNNIISLYGGIIDITNVGNLQLEGNTIKCENGSVINDFSTLSQWGIVKIYNNIITCSELMETISEYKQLIISDNVITKRGTDLDLIKIMGYYQSPKITAGETHIINNIITIDTSFVATNNFNVIRGLRGKIVNIDNNTFYIKHTQSAGYGYIVSAENYIDRLNFTNNKMYIDSIASIGQSMRGFSAVLEPFDVLSIKNNSFDGDISNEWYFGVYMNWTNGVSNYVDIQDNYFGSNCRYGVYLNYGDSIDTIVLKSNVWNGSYKFFENKGIINTIIKYDNANEDLIIKKIELYPVTGDSMRWIIINPVSATKDTSDWIGIK